MFAYLGAFFNMLNINNSLYCKELEFNQKNFHPNHLNLGKTFSFYPALRGAICAFA